VWWIVSGEWRRDSKEQRLKQEWLGLVMVTLFAIPGFAQSIGPQTPSQPSEESVQSSRKPIHVDVSLVLVNVTVTDLYDRLVTGLGKENFRVFEDGTQQEIVNFSTEDLPISIGLIFDMSGSMSDKLEKARQAAVQFLKTANPRDEFFF
jgi:Ca-activated chloride channel homolog